jgi:hypothetical protein
MVTALVDSGLCTPCTTSVKGRVQLTCITHVAGPARQPRQEGKQRLTLLALGQRAACVPAWLVKNLQQNHTDLNKWARTQAGKVRVA